MLQPKKTLVYARAFQYWVEVAHPLIPGGPHHLVENILELWQAVELLTTFSDSEVLDDTPSSGPVDPTPHECSLSLTCQAHPRGSFSVAHSRGCPGSYASHTTKTTALATPPREAIPCQMVPTSQPSLHPPGSAESVKEPPWVKMSPTPSPKPEEVMALAISG